MAWKRPTSAVAKKFEGHPSALKNTVIIFWDMECAIFIHFTPQGPDHAPRDFSMFGPMKEAIRGRRFSSEEEVSGAV
jgi:hypothetical protein